MLQAKTRPGFITRGVFDRIGNRNKLRCQDSTSSACNILIAHVYYMHDAKMHGANGCAAIVKSPFAVAR